MLAEPRCWRRGCRWFGGVKNDGDETTERVVCAAFPDGIPDEIAYGHEEHLTEWPGDRGIRFEPSKEKRTRLRRGRSG